MCAVGGNVEGSCWWTENSLGRCRWGVRRPSYFGLESNSIWLLAARVKVGLWMLAVEVPHSQVVLRRWRYVWLGVVEVDLNAASSSRSGDSSGAGSASVGKIKRPS